jgi:MarR family transcriptional regulator, organic hydroperoxide resistance regulator
MSNDNIYKLAAARHTLRSVAATMEQLVRRASGITDLTLSHALVLVSLARMPTCRQADLKSLPGIASPHLTRLLDELTDRGLVCRGRSSQDRRHVLLSLTDSGKKAASCLLTALDSLTDNEWFNALERLGASLLKYPLQQTPGAVPC